MRIAIMQPYFLPYIGYFGLFAHADLVVFFDCVQFTTRGWVHRNRFYNQNQDLIWFTLPVVKEDRFQTIQSLMFTEDGQQRLEEQKNRFPIFKSTKLADLCQFILTPNANNVAHYLEESLSLCCKYLDLPFKTIFSSSLKIDANLHAQDRIIAVCKELGASEYLNLPGGRTLYNPTRFKNENIQLSFLPPLEGNYPSIIETMERHEASHLRNMIYAQLPIPC